MIYYLAGVSLYSITSLYIILAFLYDDLRNGTSRNHACNVEDKILRHLAIYKGLNRRHPLRRPLRRRPIVEISLFSGRCRAKRVLVDEIVA